MADLSEFKKFAHHIADMSGEVIRKYFRSALSVETKHDSSPVTIADKQAEELMRECIMKNYPAHGILGEEFGSVNPEAEYQWILDPIDGTKSFISGALSFGTLIALLKNQHPILGVISHPILNEFLIGDNNQTLLNGKQVNLRKCNSISEAVLLTTDHFNIGKFKNQKNFDGLAKKVKLYRHWGDCYGYYLLSTGFADIMIDPVMSIWDSMALIPVVRGAGGVITDYEGNDPVKGKSIVAASVNIHSEIISVLNQ